MRETLRLFGQTAVILFVLWHGYAIAVYSIPRDAKDAFSQWAIRERIPEVSPYVLQTSQWQLWNLFAPDPLRRVTFYHIETERDGTWTDIETIAPGRYSVWRHATRFKLMGNMLDEFADNRGSLAMRFLQLKCEEFELSPGTPIRVVYEYYVIPYHRKRESRAWWDAWRPQPQRYTGFESVCP